VPEPRTARSGLADIPLVELNGHRHNPDAVLTERKNLNAFYDPELNVHFYHAAGDSDTDGTMWVYRYKAKK
jgi:hypothetical protein